MTIPIQEASIVRTNSKKGSLCEVNVEPVKFSDLWAKYPSSHPCVDPKTGKDPKGYEDQCAIKVSFALEKSGIKMKSFSGAICPSAYAKGRWAIRAQELADWLIERPFCGCPKVENVTGENYETTIKTRTGIIFYKDYWTRAGERTPSGDHIDLWNGSRLTASGLEGFLTTVARFYIGIQSGPNFSDLRKSKRILFWEIK